MADMVRHDPNMFRAERVASDLPSAAGVPAADASRRACYGGRPRCATNSGLSRHNRTHFGKISDSANWSPDLAVAAKGRHPPISACCANCLIRIMPKSARPSGGSFFRSQVAETLGTTHCSCSVEFRQEPSEHRLAYRLVLGDCDAVLFAAVKLKLVLVGVGGYSNA